jgi:hypothetical protein
MNVESITQCGRAPQEWIDFSLGRGKRHGHDHDAAIGLGRAD